MSVVVKSETYSTLQYPGGEFRLSIPVLTRQGYHWHSRHGEYFWLKPPTLGDLFPTLQVLEMPPAIDYEAQDLGWDLEKRISWHEWQQQCYLLAKFLKKPLRQIVDIWRIGGESRLAQLWADYKAEEDRKIQEIASGTYKNRMDRNDRP
ncbi:MAG TPA: hypothetical protein V6C65_04130 [Allocoleopsis sp.]